MSSSAAAAPLVVRSGVWDGSEVDDDDIEILRQTRWLPGRDLVRVRLAPEGEISPAPEEGERVIFRSHLMRGLGLPASGFTTRNMSTYDLLSVTLEELVINL